MATDRAPLVSINIPCYHQLAEARRCVEALLAQSFADFEVTLLDDGASADYRRYVESLGDFRVRYRQNPVRLGAMHNMFAAITFGRGTYSLAFHEDDLLDPRFLSVAVPLMERDPDCAFVACHLREFVNAPPAPDDTDDVVLERYASPAEFVRGICRGTAPMFGSVLYRRAALEGVTPQHGTFATLVDRPFLLSILERSACVIIRQPALAWYRRHGDGDERHLAMNTDHILRLFSLYRSTLPQPLNKHDASLFFAYTGYWLLQLYHLVPPESRPSIRRFVFQAWREGLYDPRRDRTYGRKRLFKALIAS